MVPAVSLDPSTVTASVPLVEVLPLAGETVSHVAEVLLVAIAV